jgi:hypothetical protein
LQVAPDAVAPNFYLGGNLRPLPNTNFACITAAMPSRSLIMASVGMLVEVASDPEDVLALHVLTGDVDHAVLGR